MSLKPCLAFSFVILLSALPLAGCQSGDSDLKRGVQGVVTLDGNPLPSGAITFIPVSHGNSAGTTVTDGQYALDPQNGVLPGEYKVEIDSSQPSGKKIRSSVGETMVEEMINIIPEKFNRKSKLTVVVKATGENQHDFELQSQ